MPDLPPTEVSNGESIQWLESIRADKFTTQRARQIITEILKALDRSVPYEPEELPPAKASLHQNPDFVCPNCGEDITEEVMFYPEGFYCIHCGQHVAGTETMEEEEEPDAPRSIQL